MSRIDEHDAEMMKDAIEQATKYIAQTSHELVQHHVVPVQEPHAELAAETMRGAFELATAVIRVKASTMHPTQTTEPDLRQHKNEGRSM